MQVYNIAQFGPQTISGATNAAERNWIESTPCRVRINFSDIYIIYVKRKQAAQFSGARRFLVFILIFILLFFFCCFRPAGFYAEGLFVLCSVVVFCSVVLLQVPRNRWTMTRSAREWCGTMCIVYVSIEWNLSTEVDSTTTYIRQQNMFLFRSFFFSRKEYR